MKKTKKEFIECILEEVKKLKNENENIVLAAKRVEKISKFKIRDYESGLDYFTNIYSFIKENNGTHDKDKKEKLLQMGLGKKIVEKVLERRRDRNRKISRVDTNILTHAPYFVGGSRKRKKKAKDEGYILLDKDGLRKMSYENSRGELLTMGDAKTLFALFSIWEEQGFGEWVKFTEYQLLDKLNMKDGGKQYKVIRNSLEKLWDTSIVMKEAYNIEKGKREVTKRFKLIISDQFISEFDKKGTLYSKTYEFQFSPYIDRSIKNGYYSLISLAVFNELEIGTAQGIYLLLTGIWDMDRNSDYVRNNGKIEIKLDELYETLFLESAKHRNKAMVESGCEELKDVGVLEDFYFKYKGKRPVFLEVQPSEWYLSILKKKDNLISIQDGVQLKFDRLLQ